MPDIPDDLDDAVAFINDLADDLQRKIAECEVKQKTGKAAAEEVRLAVVARDHFNHCAAIVTSRIERALRDL